MIKRHQDQVYFFNIRFTNFVPTQEHLRKIDRNSYIYVVITKESATDMFISESKNIAQFNSPIKCFIYQGKISLGDNSLSFNTKLTDLTKNNAFFIKTFLVNNHSETELTYFQFFASKYVEAKQLEGKNYFEENFFEKTGARIEAEVFVEKNRAALQMLIVDVNSERKKRQSFTAFKKRKENQSEHKSVNALTIQKLYIESRNDGNLLKTMQRAEIKKSFQGLKHKKSNSKQTSFGENDTQSKIRKTRSNETTQKRDKSLIRSRNMKAKHNTLDISRIQEVINSQNGSDPEKVNQVQNFSNQKTKLFGSKYRQIRSEPILQRLEKSQSETKKVLSVMTEEISQQPSLLPIGNKKASQGQNCKESINSLSSISGFSQADSRSFIEAIEIDSDAASLARTSELSARSQVEELILKRNKLFWGLLIVFALVAIFFLMVPTSSIKRGDKLLSKKVKQKH